MADVKKILVVDDHFEMLEFLRSMLELSSQDYEVLAVPSAEEGMLELRRGNFDLLITDVRLPGMSGFDLVRRTKRLGLELPVIMITAYSTAEGRKEAEELGVYQYFQKPLETDDVLTAVNKVLHGEEAELPPPKQVAVEKLDVTAELSNRLESLRVDTGALQLVLAVISGQVVHSVGGGLRVDQHKLATIIARNINDSYLLADEIGSKTPFTLQYHAGRRLELYCANVGRHYFLTLYFDANARRGRIGTIWVFTQRAIKDLAELLPEPKIVDGEQIVVQPMSLPTATTAQPPVPDDASGLAPEPEEEDFELVPAENLPTNIKIIENVAEEEPVEENFLDIDPSELAALLASDGDTPSDGSLDLDAFWDDALTETGEESEAQNQGMTLEEAMNKGLIPDDASDTAE